MGDMRPAAGERRIDIRSMLIALGILALSGVASFLGNLLIVTQFPDRPRPRDLLFELLPYVTSLRYLADIALVAGLALFVYFAFRWVPDRVPGFIAMFGIMYVLRAAFMVLTPMANAHGEGPFVFGLVQYGMFPSGHTAAAILLVRLTDRTLAPALHRIQLALALILIASFILAHGHYSIDIVGGVLLAYFIDEEWTHGRLFNPIKRAMGPRRQTAATD